jgi:hypothetical protein
VWHTLQDNQNQEIAKFTKTVAATALCALQKEFPAYPNEMIQSCIYSNLGASLGMASYFWLFNYFIIFMWG